MQRGGVPQCPGGILGFGTCPPVCCSSFCAPRPVLAGCWESLAVLCSAVVCLILPGWGGSSWDTGGTPLSIVPHSCVPVLWGPAPARAH